MSYFNPERALGAPQKEGECFSDARMLLMRRRGEEMIKGILRCDERCLHRVF